MASSTYWLLTACAHGLNTCMCIMYLLLTRNATTVHSLNTVIHTIHIALYWTACKCHFNLFTQHCNYFSTNLQIQALIQCHSQSVCQVWSQYSKACTSSLSMELISNTNKQCISCNCVYSKNLKSATSIELPSWRSPLTTL